MAQLTIRKMDEAVIERLRRRAKQSQRSLEAELRVILSDAVPAEDSSRAAVWAEIDRIRARVGKRLKRRVLDDGAKIVRAARDGRGRY